LKIAKEGIDRVIEEETNIQIKLAEEKSQGILVPRVRD